MMGRDEVREEGRGTKSSHTTLHDWKSGRKSINTARRLAGKDKQKIIFFRKSNLCNHMFIVYVIIYNLHSVNSTATIN